MEWTQPPLFNDPDVPRQITLHLGVVSGHLQWMLRAVDASSGELIGMVSVHHASTDHLETTLAHIMAELRDALEHVVSPF